MLNRAQVCADTAILYKFLYYKLDMRGRNQICDTTGMEKYLFVFQSYFHDFAVAQTLPLP